MKSDHALQNDVEQAIASATGTFEDDIEVRATEGVVTLTGSVPSGARMLDVDAAARSVEGVRDVLNKTMVALPQVPQPDGDIAKPWFP
jgi:osmotically-inducible protein OsmY